MRLRTLIAVVYAALATPAAALAQPVPVATHTLPAGPVSRLAPGDLATWRGGYWWHGWREGRVGWWWCAGGYWYWFADPIYPYPTYVPGDFVGGGYPAPLPVWWYCDSPHGYYPYVRDCSHWHAVRPGGAPVSPPPR